jgi:hypothetical protein
MLDDRLSSEPLRHPSHDPDTLSRRLEAFVGRLEEEAHRRVNRRAPIESRWIDDLRQYHGVYDAGTVKRLDDQGASRVNINLTATKTDAMVARQFDLLFPTDDRNWAIGPTPVPELTESAETALQEATQARDEADRQQAAMLEANAAGDAATAAQAEGAMREAEAKENAALLAADALQKSLEEAKRRAGLMLAEIEDQLVTSQYAKECRDAIEDRCKLGIGVLKGPIVGERIKRQWMQVEVADETGAVIDAAWELTTVADTMPAIKRVDPWHFFPDPDVRRIEDSEGVFERHLQSKKQLREMAKQADINVEGLRALLRQEPSSGVAPAYLATLSSITGQNDGEIRDRYHVWEYTGPLEAEDMKLLAEGFDDRALYDDMENRDPLEAVHAKVVFCQGVVLRFALHPLDSGETIYSCTTIRPDETSVFGYGIPFIMRDPQSVLNGAYRMMLDNAALGTGPQILVNKSAVEPQDGDSTMRPRKVWEIKDTYLQTQGGPPPFSTFDVPTHQGELAAIIGLASETINEVTAMPAIAQGEPATQARQTAQGTAILMNSANVGFRRLVTDWDDDITVPVIRRLYHWNMQFNPKGEIKGDYEVEARGSSVLLVREMQSQNLMTVAQAFGDHPVYGPRIKHGDLLRSIFRSLMIPADEVVLSDTEFEKAQKQQAEGEAPDPRVQAAELEAAVKREEIEARKEEMQLKAQIANQDNDTRKHVAAIERETKLMELAERMNMNRDQLEAMLAKANMETASKERGMAVEVAVRQQTGVSSGGAV